MSIELLVVLALSLAVMTVIILLIFQMFQSQMKELMKFTERTHDNYILERERLLNRAMSKDWQTYLALQTSQVVSPSEEDDEYVGMSDADEIARSGYVDPSGIGDVFTDADASAEFRTSDILDAQDLGLFDG